MLRGRSQYFPKGVMRRLRRWLIVLASIVAAVVSICILLVVIPLAIGAHNANDNIAAMGRLINIGVVPGTTAPRVRAFLHGHDTLTLPHGHFVGGGGATPFVHLPRYDPNDGEDQIYPGGEALFALWFGPSGEELDVVFFFDGKGHLVRHSVDEIWLHMP
jgi:hypothetical protein